MKPSSPQTKQLPMRFALYYSPDQDSQFHDCGAHWLGYDAFTGQKQSQPGAGLLLGKTETAARYGFHATLKPPFHLTSQARYEELEAATEMLAASLRNVIIPNLVLRELDGFLALVPEEQDASLSHLADVCVTALDPLREPPDESEKQRRKAAGLTPRQLEYLETWGYPYVFEEFRFHITLTNKLASEELEAVHSLAAKHFSGLIGRPLTISALTIFAEPEADGRFFVKRHFPLNGKSNTGAA